MKAFVVSVAIVLAAVVAWFVSHDEPRPQVVVLPHPQALPASAALSLMALGGQPDNTMNVAERNLSIWSNVDVATTVSTDAAEPAIDESRYYRSPKSAQDFFDRRGREEKARHEAGLPETKILPTPEEKAVIILDFAAVVREILKDVGRVREYNIAEVLGDIREVGISVDELDHHTRAVLERLAQEQAEYQAPHIQNLLNRGCYNTASDIFSRYIGRAAEVLGNNSLFGYHDLYHQIQIASAPEHAAYEQAGENAQWRAAVDISVRQRAKALGVGCGYG